MTDMREVSRFIVIGIVVALVSCGDGTTDPGQTNPAPTIGSFTPPSSITGLDGLGLTISGSGFLSSTELVIGGTTRSFTLVTGTGIETDLTPNDLRDAGSLSVSVTNPSPGGGTAAGNFPVTDACTVLASGVPFNAGHDQFGFAEYRVELDQESVFWVEWDGTSAIKKVGKNGGTATVIADELGSVNQIAVDADNVYWTETDPSSGNGSINSAPKIGGGPTTVLATGTPAGSSFDVFTPMGIALDATNVYWGEPVGGGAIRQVPKAGGDVEDIGRGSGAVWFIALDQDETFFYIGNSTGTYERMPLGGGARETLASGLGNTVGGLALDAGFVYWANTSEPGTVFAIPVDGGTPIQLAGDLANPRGAALNGTQVYYQTGEQFHGIQRVSKAGGTPVGLANCSRDTAAFAYAVAVDQTSVYAVGAMGPTGTAVVFKLSK